MSARVEWTNTFLVRSNVNTFKARISSSKPSRGARPSLMLFSRTSPHIAESPHSRARSTNRRECSESVWDQLKLKEPWLMRNRAIFLFLSVGPSPFHLSSFLSAYFAPPMSNSDVGSSPPQLHDEHRAAVPCDSGWVPLDMRGRRVAVTYNM